MRQYEKKGKEKEMRTDYLSILAPFRNPALERLIWQGAPPSGSIAGEIFIRGKSIRFSVQTGPAWFCSLSGEYAQLPVRKVTDKEVKIFAQIAKLSFGQELAPISSETIVRTFKLNLEIAQ